MAIGTIDRTPPPFFRQGPSALTKFGFCSALALFLMVADTRFGITQPVRIAAAAALQPLQRVLLVPVDAWVGASDYLMGLQAALSSEAVARRQLVLQSERAMRADQLLRENERLRALLELRPGLTVRSQAAQILYEASDPYSRKVVIDHGSAQGIALGSPVVNEAGVLGQVTRVYLMSAEVTLLTDRDAAIPVLNSRTLARSIAFGGAATTGATMEMRFMAGNADVRVGDALTTSGVDGVYPPGLTVATVASVDRKADSGFARILLTPTASSDGVRHVLVLEPIGLQMPERPALGSDGAKEPTTRPGMKAKPQAAAASASSAAKDAMKARPAPKSQPEVSAAAKASAGPKPETRATPQPQAKPEPKTAPSHASTAAKPAHHAAAKASHP
jgi:rod shape-determining protein MreC